MPKEWRDYYRKEEQRKKHLPELDKAVIERRRKEPQSALGENGMMFLVMFPVGIVVSIIVGWIFYGDLPRWLERLLQ